MSVMKKAKDIRVSISGLPGSGKSTLCEWLNNHESVRPVDGQRFRLHVDEKEKTSELFEGAQLSLLTFPIDLIDLIGKETLKQYRTVIYEKYIGRKDDFCLVVTKGDLTSNEVQQRQYAMCIPSLVALFYDIECVVVSSWTGEGLDNLCLLIADKTYPPELQTFGSKYFKSLKTWVLDSIAWIFSLPVPQNINRDTGDTFEIPDDDFVFKLQEEPEAAAFYASLGAYYPNAMDWSQAYKITPTLLSKKYSAFEANNANFVRSNTNIPVPQFRYPHLKERSVLDYIPGRPLVGCWDSFGRFYQFRIVCTLRYYVSQLRRLSRKSPGSAVGELLSNYLFDDVGFHHGPFRDSEVFRHYVEHIAFGAWIKLVLHFPDQVDDISRPPTFPAGTEWRLVFTHCDISLANVMLSDDGVLYVIDWEASGFYPPWFESFGMKRYDRTAPESWTCWRTFIAGSYPELERIWRYFLHHSVCWGTDVPRGYYWPNGEHWKYWG